MFYQLFNKPRNLKNDVLSGLTVALALVPEAVAFAFIAGVPPQVGLWAAFMVGLVTAVIGGRPGMISGATGALAVVMVGLMASASYKFGADVAIQYLFATVLLMGFFQIMAGVFKLGKFIRIVPHPVMLGFVNGLAIVIFLSQIGQFKTPDFGINELSSSWLASTELLVMGGLILLTMAIIYLLPKLTKAFPSTLAAILIVSGLAISLQHFANISTPNVQDVLVNMTAKTNEMKAFEQEIPQEIKELQQAGIALNDQQKAKLASIEKAIVDLNILQNVRDDAQNNNANTFGATIAGLPAIGLPDVPFNFTTLMFILPFALILAAIGLIESLLTLTLIDEITQTRGRSNRECVGQGTANVFSGLIGSMGGCAMIGQSMINISSGGRGRTSGIAAAIFLLIFILFASSWIEMIPVAALIGVMFIVVIGTFEWASLRLWKKIPMSDFLTIFIVASVTVAFDLAIAVFVGVIVSALVFAWQHAKRMRVETKMEKEVKIYLPNGPLFFAAVHNFSENFTPNDDPDEVIIDFINCKVVDHSAIEAIDSVAVRYKNAGKNLHLRHLSADCKALLQSAGDMIEVNVLEDPAYYVADDKLA
ncbi:SulP family inorganic anion transporter [Marinicellulosiphila megalodicopiae]|uniref:SulP family inorganic anion transporter n=1 Tax=Marinicellulosiphila megalodicopiae TaxID=2724896 RepID=UPI003BAE2A56